MAAQDALTRYLHDFRDLLAASIGLRAQGFAYDSPVDFLLQHGQWYVPHALPPDILRGAPKCCFGNALVASIMHDLRYIEGYASVDLGGGALPFEHAWCADAIGAVYEVTWPTVGLAYFGVEFCVERADDCTWNGDATVLWDGKRGFPLLRTPWTGEPLMAWPHSPRLALVRREKATRRTRIG